VRASERVNSERFLAGRICGGAGGGPPGQGRAVQVHPIKPTLAAPGTKRLKLEYEKLISDPGFNFDLRRYNKDTTGLLLLTDDGTLLHRMTSPKKNVPKVYEIELDMDVPAGAVAAFASGELMLKGRVWVLRLICSPCRIYQLRGIYFDFRGLSGGY